MKTLHTLMGVLVFVVLAVAGIVLVRAAWGTADWDALSGTVAKGRFIGMGAGVALVCVAVLFVLTAIPVKKRERFLSFENESGRVSISTEAICEYLLKLAGEFPSIIRMRPKVVPAKSAIDIIVDVRIKAGPQIHEVCEVLQNRIRESMASGLGISEVRRVEVSVREISSEHKSA